jgi:hypothetical protein
MRLPAADIAIIDRAARLRGHARTEFVSQAAVRAPEEAIMESAPIRISQEGFRGVSGGARRPGGAGTADGRGVQAQGTQNSTS